MHGFDIKIRARLGTWKTCRNHSIVSRGVGFWRFLHSKEMFFTQFPTEPREPCGLLYANNFSEKICDFGEVEGIQKISSTQTATTVKLLVSVKVLSILLPGLISKALIQPGNLHKGGTSDNCLTKSLASWTHICAILCKMHKKSEKKPF